MPGMTNSSVPTTSAQNAGTEGCGKYQSASGCSASHCISGQVHCSSVTGSARTHSPAGNHTDATHAPSSTAGTTTSVNNGIATAFARGDSSETPPNAASSNGTRPTVTAA